MWTIRDSDGATFLHNVSSFPSQGTMANLLPLIPQEVIPELQGIRDRHGKTALDRAREKKKRSSDEVALLERLALDPPTTLVLSDDFTSADVACVHEFVISRGVHFSDQPDLTTAAICSVVTNAVESPTLSVLVAFVMVKSRLLLRRIVDDLFRCRGNMTTRPMVCETTITYVHIIFKISAFFWTWFRKLCGI